MGSRTCLRSQLRIFHRVRVTVMIMPTMVPFWFLYCGRDAGNGQATLNPKPTLPSTQGLNAELTDERRSKRGRLLRELRLGNVNIRV